MKRYDFPTPRLAFGLAAVALAALTLGAALVVPASLEPARDAPPLVANAAADESYRTEVIVTPTRIDVIARADVDDRSGTRPRRPAEAQAAGLTRRARRRRLPGPPGGREALLDQRNRGGEVVRVHGADLGLELHVADGLRRRQRLQHPVLHRRPRARFRVVGRDQVAGEVPGEEIRHRLVERDDAFQRQRPLPVGGVEVALEVGRRSARTSSPRRR